MSVIATGNPARYFKLSNDVGCIAHMVLKWNKGDQSGEYRRSGYDDVIYGQERTIDMAVTDIPEGAEVELHVDIDVITDKRANETFIYKKSSPTMICYQLDGSIISNELIRYSPKYFGE